jgi:hypothetical protein
MRWTVGDDARCAGVGGSCRRCRGRGEWAWWSQHVIMFFTAPRWVEFDPSTGAESVPVEVIEPDPCDLPARLLVSPWSVGTCGRMEIRQVPGRVPQRRFPTWQVVGFRDGGEAV